MTPGPILVLGAGLSPAALKVAADAGVRVEFVAPYPDEGTLIAAIERHRPSVIVVRTATVTAAAIRAGVPELKLIAKHGVGVDTIDVAAATLAGVSVSVTTGANAQSVAEHALALILAAARSIPTLDRRMREGHWDKPSATGTELFGKTLGVIGFGAIARLLSDLVSPLRMPVLVHDPYAKLDGVAERVRRAASLDDLLTNSDVVSLHCPLTADTRHMIGEEQLGRMRADSILVNTARGGLVDEAALARALHAGRLAGAGLDTFGMEPPIPGSPLFDAPNLVLTPHVGASTDEAKERVGTTAIRQAVDVLAGRLPEAWMLVNPRVGVAA